MFDTFITPAAGWQPPSIQIAVKPMPSRVLSKPLARHWADDAAEEAWEPAIVGYLREHRRETVPYWRLVNILVAESMQASRWEVRYATRQVLAAIQLLLKSRRILRFRRKYLVILDTGDAAIPLEIYYALPTKTANGRAIADSTSNSEVVKIAPNRR